MNNQDFAQWEPLVHHVVNKYFYWAYSSRATRTIYRDLVDEGNAALVSAWKQFDPNHVTDGRTASFKTYAYKTILRRLVKYVENNLIRPGGTKLFSEIDNASGCDFSQLVEGKGPGPEIPTDNREWIENCMRRLRNGLGRRRVGFLLRRAKGENLKSLGESMGGFTRQHAHGLLAKWLVIATAILSDQEEMMDEK